VTSVGGIDLGFMDLEPVMSNR